MRCRLYTRRLRSVRMTDASIEETADKQEPPELLLSLAELRNSTIH